MTPNPARTALRFDHSGIAVRDLARARETFTRLGFRMTPLSVHSGSLGPGQPIVPWGTANHCAMFEDGYLETLGPHGAEIIPRMKAMLDRYEGVQIVALGCDNAEDCHRDLLAAGAPAEPIKALQRMAPYGERGDEERLARFKLVGMASPPYAEARIQVTEHLTREVLWQPWLLKHPNGAKSIEEAVFQADDAASVAARYQAHLGGTLAEGEHGMRLKLARGSFYFVTPQAWRKWVPEAPSLPVPAPVALVIGVESLDLLERTLAAGGFATRRDAVAGVIVGGNEAHGATLFFRGRT